MPSAIEITKLYIDSAKSFVQLSSAGLALPVVLSSKILGLFRSTQQFNHFSLAFICLSWGCFLVAIGAGVLYQYAAVKFLEYEADNETYVPRALQSLVNDRGPGVAFGVMTVAFYAGAVSVVIYSLIATLYH